MKKQKWVRVPSLSKRNGLTYKCNLCGKKITVKQDERLPEYCSCDMMQMVCRAIMSNHR